MNYYQLGRSILRVSQIGFGCMSLDCTDSRAALILQRAVDLGINFFDTADIYQDGKNEEFIGKALHHKRKDIVLATKVGNVWRKDLSGLDWNPGKAHIIQAAEESLKRLRTDYIDLYQLHGGTIDDPVGETIEAFELLKSQGKILEYGISSIRPNVIRGYIKGSSMVAVMMQYSLLDRRPEEQCLDLLQSAGISVLARGGLAKGLLVDKAPAGFLQYGQDEVALVARALQLLSSPTRTVSQTAIQWIFQQAVVASVVVGIRTMEQLSEAAAAPSTPALLREEWNRLNCAVPINRYEQYR